MKLKSICKEIGNCKVCAEFLPLPPRPVLSVSKSSRILVIGQAPGTKVHNTGIPWNDPSGDELRRWLDVDKELFYNANIFGIAPMGFCYPGKGKSGDLPPRPECAPLWHEKLFQHMPNVKLTLLIGQYAQKYYLKNVFKKNLTENVRSFQDFLPQYFPLVHPSPRNRLWQVKNPWFETDVVVALREAVSHALKK